MGLVADGKVFTEARRARDRAKGGARVWGFLSMFPRRWREAGRILRGWRKRTLRRMKTSLTHCCVVKAQRMAVGNVRRRIWELQGS